MIEENRDELLEVRERIYQRIVEHPEEMIEKIIASGQVDELLPHYSMDQVRTYIVDLYQAKLDMVRAERKSPVSSTIH